MLERMSPWEYTDLIRPVLGHGSGFDSPGRIIGDQVVGTQGTPVEVLGRLIHKSLYPELWEVRNELTARSSSTE
jgi:tryptophan 2,3-dioxygenase